MFESAVDPCFGGGGQLGNVAVVSTNYDIRIDSALTEEYAHGTDLDCGVEPRNFDKPGDWRRLAFDSRVQLPHGSLNWCFARSATNSKSHPTKSEASPA